ncbi:hypothetical protein [uncultured Kushneria sp.]|uniref:hypothetical protein n=1 Tax=uncultured Kushneria sp. TaxID=905033 RepID=UPI00262145CA|nr:hypothetical protein [uncultured Kushneria sp.]
MRSVVAAWLAPAVSMAAAAVNTQIPERIFMGGRNLLSDRSMPIINLLFAISTKVRFEEQHKPTVAGAKTDFS